MKITKLTVFSLALTFIFQHGSAQTINWNSGNDSRHVLYLGSGWDYGLSGSLGYGYRFKNKRPFILHANFSIPFGEKLLDDFKTKIGGQVLLLDHSSFKGIITLDGIYRRYGSPLVRLQNFGTEINGIFGYYQPKWFVAGKVGFDKAIVTHFKHSQLFKDNVFQGVKNGWYEPATGGNFLVGLQTGYSFKRSDITLNLGMVKAEDLKSAPQIPFYLMFGYNYRLP